jgi:hypothetical protein
MTATLEPRFQRNHGRALNFDFHIGTRGDPIVPDTDEHKPVGKSAQRNRKTEKRNRKPDQKRSPKPDQKTDQLQAAKQQIDAPIASAAASPIFAQDTHEQTGADVTSTDAPPIDAHDVEALIGAAMTSADADLSPVAAEAVEEQAGQSMASTGASPVAAEDIEEQAGVAMASTDASPVAAEDVEEQAGAALASTEISPIAAQDIKEPGGAQAAKELIDTLTTSTDAAPIGTAVSAGTVPVSLQTIANAYGDYTRKSFEQTKSFFDKLTGVRSLDKAVEVQTEFAKQAYETFFAESRRIRELHNELAMQPLKRLEGFVARVTAR